MQKPSNGRQMEMIGEQISSSAFSRRGVLASGIGTALTGCTAGSTIPPTSPIGSSGAIDPSGLDPLDLNPANLIRITVCLRPFRSSGPRLEMEPLDDRKLVHNYGHGGAGWSLAWGYAQAVRDMLAKEKPSSVSVLGAGAIGLTTAITLAETGAKVTVFARELPSQSASSKATGVWSPSSRIGMADAVSSDFAAGWEMLARRSYARHLQYVGRAGNPVEFTPRFYIRSETPEAPLAAPIEGAGEFLNLGRYLRGLAPPWRTRDVHPFPTTERVRGGLVMTFNIAEYARQLTEDFLAMGGQFVRAQISGSKEMKALPGDAIINCSGFGARTLLSDESVTPVRGQIAWMAAQTDRLYGVYHRGVMALPRRDGLLIQETGGTDFFGFDQPDETPSREEFLNAHAKVAPIFAW